MATYKQNVGTTVVNYAGNYPGAVEGELWYDSSNYAWKYQYPNTTTAGAWSTANPMNTGRQAHASSGIYTSALAFGGSPSEKTETELYNGSNWTEVNDLNTGRWGLGGGGTSTSTLAFGGGTPPVSATTELWNGPNWTEVK